MEQQNANKDAWYEKTWVVVLLCIIFFPVGLYALWKNSSIGKGWKIGVTVVFALGVIANFAGGDKDTEKVDATEKAEQAAYNALSQEQKDSIAKAERIALYEERKNQTRSAETVVGFYEENEVSADEGFKGKIFYIEGYIDNIGKDIVGDIYVTLDAGRSFRKVQCFIDDVNKVKQLQKGQLITVYGKCDGLMMNVLMRDCKLVENLSDLEPSK